MKSSICHVLSKLSTFDVVDWKVSDFFHNVFKPFCFKNQAQLSSHLWTTCWQRIHSNDPEIVWLDLSAIECFMSVLCSWTCSPCRDIKTLSGVIPPTNEPMISYERAKIASGQRIISFARAEIPFGERIINSPGSYLNPTRGQKSTVSGRQKPA